MLREEQRERLYHRLQLPCPFPTRQAKGLLAANPSSPWVPGLETELIASSKGLHTLVL